MFSKKTKIITLPAKNKNGRLAGEFSAVKNCQSEAVKKVGMKCDVTISVALREGQFLFSSDLNPTDSTIELEKCNIFHVLKICVGIAWLYFFLTSRWPIESIVL